MSGTRKAGLRSRGYFGIAVYGAKIETNVGTLWRSAFLYDAAFVGTVGKRYKYQSSDTPNTANHVPLVHYEDIEDLVSHLPFSCPLVGVELDGRAVPLPQFHHPERAVYLLGAEDNGLPASVMAQCHRVIQIPGERDWSMNVSAAGAIVMYDRFAKSRAARSAVAS
jgi:tRNA G18 (ribose-2'-O)-methylase SpoU